MKIKLFTIPNIITLCNLLCGSMAVLSAVGYGDIKSAFYLILAAAVCDFLDGASARLLKLGNRRSTRLFGRYGIVRTCSGDNSIYAHQRR